MISKPTLTSFFLDFTGRQVEEEGSEALSDFVFYLPDAEDKLRATGVQVYAGFQSKELPALRSDTDGGRRGHQLTSGTI